MWLIVALTTIHLLTFTIGNDFKKLRNAIFDNENLIHNLDQGVVVLSSDQEKVEFSNRAALNLEILNDKSFEMTVQKINGDEQKLSKEDMVFGLIDKSIFKQKDQSFDAILNKIKGYD